MKARTARPLSALLAFLIPVLAHAGTPDPGIKPPTEDGLYLVLSGGKLVKVPRLTGKPCDVATAGAPAEVAKIPGREKFTYVPVSVLKDIPVVSSEDVQGAYMVTRDERLEGLRNVISLKTYLDGRKILTGAYKDGCAEGEIGDGDRGEYLVWSAWGWPFDKVIRATYVSDTVSWLSFESRLPLQKGETRPIVGPKEEKIGSFGIYVATNSASYPFIPSERLAGFLADAVAHGDELPPHVVDLAGMMEKHLAEAKGAKDPAAWDVVASVYEKAGLTKKAQMARSHARRTS